MPEISRNLEHYGLVDKTGKSGRGAALRAKDQRLGRDVAVKILHDEFAIVLDLN